MNVYKYEAECDGASLYATVIATSKDEADNLINDEAVYQELGIEWELMYFANDPEPQVLTIDVVE